MGILDSIYQALGIRSESTVTPAPLPTAYPTSEDARFANKSGFGYGTPFESFLLGQREKDVGQPRGYVSDINAKVAATPITDVAPGKKDEKSDFYTAAALVANRSPLTAIGFNPTKFGIENSGKETGLSGYYTPKTDTGYVNATGQDTLVHESTHRGIELLKRAGVFSPEETKWLENPKTEEYIVRYLMQKYAGVKPPSEPIDKIPRNEIGKQQEQAAQFWFEKASGSKEWRNMLESIEQKAAAFGAKQKPGGPR